MHTPNQHHATAAVRSRLTQFRAGLSKLLSVSRATAKHFAPVSAAKRKERLREQLAQSYRLTNTDEVLAFVKSHKYLVPLLDIIPGKIRTVLATEPEKIHGLDLEYYQDLEDADEYLSITVNTNVDNADRMLEIYDVLLARVLEPLYQQANGHISITVEFP
ncbi:MAG: hypothetical protein K0U66_06555 [Gammaproteobacteria bacterium]|nr:hypothetical protein [Pseudomonadota bacterium]MCH9663302.1 hypothetical protein [Gammaproteobacteria bacterium]